MLKLLLRVDTRSLLFFSCTNSNNDRPGRRYSSSSNYRNGATYRLDRRSFKRDTLGGDDRKIFEECISVKEETSGSVDEPDVIVPASLDYSSCQCTLTENLGDDDLVLPGCQPETSTCDLEDAKISTSFSESDFENKECIDTTNHFVPGDCENEEFLDDTLNSRACETFHPVLKEMPIASIPDAASSSELVDVSAGNSVLSEWDYTGSGSFKEVIEHETMLGESCIMVYSNDPCPDKHQLTKQRADAKKLPRKPGLRVAVIKDGDSIPEPKADESSGGGGHSTPQLEMLPLAPEFELTNRTGRLYKKEGNN